MKHRAKCILSMFLALTMLLGIGGTALASRGNGEDNSIATFSDVAKSSWYYEYVTAMVESGIIDGYPDGSFRPDSSVSWGEALKMVLLYANYDEQSSARDYINLAIKEGILDATVEQDVAITRLEMCQVVAKALKIESSQEKSSFPDTNDAYVTALVKLGVINGINGNFRPNDKLTRAQLCKILYTVPAPTTQLPYPWAADLKEGDVVTDIDGDALLETYDEQAALFDEHTFKAINPDVGDMTYYVYDPTAHGFPADGSYPVVMWFHGRDNAFLGRRVITAGGAAGMATPEAQAELGGMYIICPLANEDKESAGWWVQHAEGIDSENPKELIEGDGIYNTSLKGILDEVKANNPAINDTLLLAGTSAGGMCIDSFMNKYHDTLHVSGIFWMSTLIPSAEKVKQYSDEGTRMWFEISKHDELSFYYVNFPDGDTSAYDSIENFELTAFDWVRCADKTIASCFLGVYQGQHCSCFQVNHNLMFDDGTPYDEKHPDGVTGWFKSVITGEKSTASQPTEGASKPSYPWAADLKEGDVVTDIDGDALLETYTEEMALFDEYTFKAINSDVGDMTYYVYDPTAHGFPADETYPVVMWLHGRGNGTLGRRAIAGGGAAGMASEEAQTELGGMYIICPLANEEKETAGWWVQHSKGVDSENPKDLIEGDGVYNTSLKGILDEVRANNPAINDTLLLAGTSAGGMCIDSFMKKYHDTLDVSGIFWMSTIIPSAETIKQYSDEGTRMWFEISKHDELGFYYSNFPEGDTSAYDNIENFELTAFDWIRCADKTIASCFLGVYQGQHCSCFQVNHNLIFDDGTPYDEKHPDGVTGWFRSVIAKTSV